MTRQPISPTQYRAALVAERDTKLAMADEARKVGDKLAASKMVKEARQLIDEITEIDEARAWINQQETQPKISFDMGRKTFNQ